MTRNFAIAAAMVAAALTAGAQQAQAYTLYVNSSSGLEAFDTNAGVSTLIGATGLHNMALSFDAAGNLFGATTTKLYSVDTATGAASLIGSHGVAGLEGLTFNAAGELLGSGGSSIYKINTATAASTLAGATGLNDIDGLTRAPVAVALAGGGTAAAGTLFATDSTNLYMLDSVTYAATSVGSYNADETLAFAPDGSLYGIFNSVYALDLGVAGSSTLAGSLLGSQAFGSAFFLGGGGGPGPAAVPLPAALPMLAFAVGALGFAARRKTV